MKSQFRKLFLPIVILILYELFFFRNIIASDLMVGDRGDGRLCMLIAEHWYQFFSGNEPFAQLNMFYPAQNTVAYSDMLLGYGIVHSILRFIGVNIFDSYKYTLILIHFLGVLSTFYLLYSKLRIRIGWAFIGTISFAFSNVYAYKFMHSQLNAISLVPVLLIAIIDFFQYFNNKRKRNRSAYCAILVFALLMYTSWYIAFFSFLFCGIFAVLFIVLSWHNDGIEQVLTMIREFFINIGLDIVKYVSLTAAVMAPFAILYIPILKMNGSRSYGEVAYYLPKIADLFNVTTDNLFLGRLIDKMRLSSGETAEGYSVIFWLLFIVCILSNARMQKKHGDQMVHRVENCAVYAVLASILLMLKLSSSGISLWIFVYKLIPGAGSIRAVARYLFFLTFPMSIMIAFCGNKAFAKQMKGIRQYAIFIITGVLLFASNIYGSGVSAHWNAKDESNFIENVRKPPKDCEVFYITDSSDGAEAPYLYQLDAFEIAAKFNLKTINGYSGIFPENWQGIWEVGSADYEENIFSWIKDHHLTNVYAYDKSMNTWETRGGT